MLGELGYGFAHAVLDAQFFGLAQRRARVFVVGYLGDWRPPAAVLFERESLRGDSPPSREKGEGTAVSPSLRTRANSSHRADSQAYVPEVSPSLKARDFKGPSSDGDGDGAPLVTHALTGEGFDASEDGTGRRTPLVAHAFNWQSGGDMRGVELTPTTSALSREQTPADAFSITPSNSNKDYNARAVDKSQALTSGGNRPSARGGDLVATAFTLHGADKTVSTATQTDIAGSIRTKPPGSIENSSTTVALQQAAVRRLTPKECLRLQGFPDEYFDGVLYRGKPLADGPKYKMLGNSFAVPVVRWIGERIALVDRALLAREASEGDARHD
jgi:DNA (cytosine-5)-methyltransferase 1